VGDRRLKAECRGGPWGGRGGATTEPAGFKMSRGCRLSRSSSLPGGLWRTVERKLDSIAAGRVGNRDSGFLWISPCKSSGDGGNEPDDNTAGCRRGFRGSEVEMDASIQLSNPCARGDEIGWGPGEDNNASDLFRWIRAQQRDEPKYGAGLEGLMVALLGYFRKSG